MSDIKIVYIITKLELGGAQKICLSLFKNIKSSNLSTYLISGNTGYFVPAVSDDHSVFLLKNLKREISILNILNEIRSIFKIYKKLKELKKLNKNIIVHTHSTKAGIIGRWVALFAGIKHRIHTVHGFGFHDNQNRISWFITYILELFTSFITSHFICVSQEDVKTGSKLFPNFSKKSSIIRAAVDFKKLYTPSYKAINYPVNNNLFNNIFIFGTIACFKPQKNLIDLLEAFKLVHNINPNTRLEIIGDGFQRNIIENWILSNNLSEAIFLHGWQEDVSLFLKKWHVFTLSSLWEGLPCSVVEARLFKLPVLSYDVGGIREVIKDSENGFLYKPQDWHSLANGMIRVSQDQELFLKLQNYSDDLSEFNDQYMICKHINLYKNLYSQLKI